MDAQAMLWELGKRGVDTGEACVLLVRQIDCMRFPQVLHAYALALLDPGPNPDEGNRRRLGRMVDEAYPLDDGLDGRFETEELNRRWWFARMLSETDSVRAGLHRRAHRVAYYATKLGVPHDAAAQLVRSVFPEEKFEWQ